MFNYDISEEEINYYYGVLRALRYYKDCHKAGFTIKPDEPYYVDFDDYNVSQGYSSERDFEAKIYSILKPFMDIDGYADVAEYLGNKHIDEYVEVGLPDIRTYADDENNVFCPPGFYASILSTVIKKYFEMGFTVDETLEGYINRANSINNYAFEVDIPEVVVIINSTGLYLFLADACCMDLDVACEILDMFIYMKEKVEGVGISENNSGD